MGIGKQVLDEAKRFKAGDKVEFAPKSVLDISYYIDKGLKKGVKGVISIIHGARGKGVWCDPSKMLIAVKWEDFAKYGGTLCVPPGTLKRVK